MRAKLLSRVSLKEELTILMKDIILLKGSVAFWTWDLDYVQSHFGDTLFNALEHTDSFYCVDISTPSTKIDNLSRFAEKHNKFYVYNYINTLNMNRHLLHSKILYLLTETKQYLIIGSHNNTRSAFEGMNIEHSLLLTFDKNPNEVDQQLLDSFVEELNKIKTDCHPFDFNKIDDYKLIQKRKWYAEEDKSLKFILIEMEREEDLDLQNNQLISVISFNKLWDKKGIKKDIYSNKELIIVASYKDKYRIFKCYGEADDAVGKNAMDNKVTESDFIAFRIPAITDLFELPLFAFKFKTSGQKTVKGETINEQEHVIHRFRVLDNIQEDQVYFIQKSKQNYEKNIVDLGPDDREKLGIENNEYYIKIIKKINVGSNLKGRNISSSQSTNRINVNQLFVPIVEDEIKNKINSVLSSFFKSICSGKRSVDSFNELTEDMILALKTDQTLEYADVTNADLDRIGKIKELTKKILADTKNKKSFNVRDLTCVVEY
jgi:hypothetical protein